MSTHVNRGLAWLGFASTAVGLLDIVATLLILNFWITGSEYGIATKAIWVFPILDQATDLGLTAALIQRDDHTESRVSTVFWVNVLLSIAAFGILLVAAPLLARHFYHEAIVGSLLIAYSTKLLLQNAFLIPNAMMKRQLRFKELSIIRILANLAEFFGKVGFAAAGFGIWCFVLGPLARTLVYAVGLQSRSPFRPRASFNLRDAKEYLTFGLRTSGSQILFYFYTNVDYPIVGFFFGNTALGFYKLAYEIVLEPVRVISNVVIDIAFPTFARLRHSKDELVAQFVSFTKLNLITVMSYAVVVFVAAPDVLAVLFPDYPEAVDAVRILCAVAVLRAVGFVVPPLLDGVGRPDRTLSYMTSAAVVMPIMYVLGAVLLGDRIGFESVVTMWGVVYPIPFGVHRAGFESVAIAWAVGYPIAFGVLIYMATHTLGWSAWQYGRRVIGVAGCLIAGGVVAALVHYAVGATAPVIRLLAATATVLVVSGFLLAYTQGLSLRTALRSVREPPPP
jgi:O-antigen/teichoic acid export membrane protein